MSIAAVLKRESEFIMKPEGAVFQFQLQLQLRECDLQHGSIMEPVFHVWKIWHNS